MAELHLVKELPLLGKATFKLSPNRSLEIDIDEYVKVRQWLMSIPGFKKPYAMRMISALRVTAPSLTLREGAAIDRTICRMSGLAFRREDEEPLGGNEVSIINVEVPAPNGEPFVVG